MGGWCAKPQLGLANVSESYLVIHIEYCDAPECYH